MIARPDPYGFRIGALFGNRKSLDPFSYVLDTVANSVVSGKAFSEVGRRCLQPSEGAGLRARWLSKVLRR